MTTHDISMTIENYLGIIYVLERDGEPIIGARLATLLGVTPPTVTNTLKRMLRDGLLVSDEINGLHLSPEGLDSARSIMRKHMLSEWMLAKVLSWSRLHDEAHHLEHGISDAVEKALLKELGDPELCPHGNPLPGNEAAVENWISLQRMKKGERVVIRRVHELAEETPELLDFLEANGIVLGKEVEVGDVLGFNQTVTIQVDSHPVTLGFSTAKYIFVEPMAIPIAV
jgi:DtxR family Mn-dependent transcriptional regulator